MDSLEKQLRSWRPRRPSRRLKWRLFGFAFGPGSAWVLGSLGPAAACALLTFGIFNSHNNLTYSPVHELLASNWSDATFVSDGFADKQNHWSSVTFESTNRSGSGFSMGSFRH